MVGKREYNSVHNINIMLTVTSFLAILSRVTRQAVALDVTGSADLAALLVLVARTEIACAQVTDSPIAGVSVITTSAGFAGGAGVAGRATTSLDLDRSSVSDQILHCRVHADVADVCRGHSLAVGCADQNSLKIGKNDHEIRPRSAVRSFGGQSSPFVLFQRYGVGL